MAARGPSLVRNVKHRTPGSGVTLLDEWSVPFALWHGWRAVKWTVRHRWGAGFVLLWWFWWASTGSMVIGLLFAVMLYGGGLTAWLWWRTRGAEGASPSLREAWGEHRQKRVLEKQWPLACETAGLTGPGREGEPPLRKVRGNGYGTITATVRSGQMGIPVFALQKQTAHLAEVIGCREVSITQTDPGVAMVAFHWRDPVGRALPLADLPAAPKDRLAFGIRQGGSVAAIRPTLSVLIGGLTGMGKSNVVWALLADCIRQGIPVDLYVSDPKGGVELDAFEGVEGNKTGLLRVRRYAKDPKQTGEMLAQAEKALRCRQEEMKRDGVRKLSPGYVTLPDGTDKRNPLVVVLLDETLPLTDMLKRGTDSPLGRIAYEGRHAAYVVWANTQVGQIDALGRFRDLLPQRICFATPNPQVTDSILGQGAEGVGAACSRLKDPGLGFSYSEGDRTPQKFRAAKVEDKEAKMIATGRLPQAVVTAHQQHVDMAAQDSKSRACSLYRWYHADAPEGSQPAYIGISYDVLHREAQHSAALREFMQGDVRRTVEEYPDRKSALRAEKAAILAERPLYNKQHNQSNPFRKVDLRKPRGGKSKDAA